MVYARPLAILCYHSDTMTRRRLVLFLLLNALVSVLVSGAAWYFYDRSHPKTDCSTNVTIPTIAPGSIHVDVVSVTGAGVIASESITLQNNDAESIQLTGWTIKNNLGSAYTFPVLTLYPGGIVRLHSGPGTDTASDLYWGLAATVWKSGELVALSDTQNIMRAFYRVP
jgi:hypothetical protein